MPSSWGWRFNLWIWGHNSGPNREQGAFAVHSLTVALRSSPTPNLLITLRPLPQRKLGLSWENSKCHIMFTSDSSFCRRKQWLSVSLKPRGAQRIRRPELPLCLCPRPPPSSKRSHQAQRIRKNLSPFPQLSPESTSAWSLYDVEFWCRTCQMFPNLVEPWRSGCLFSFYTHTQKERKENLKIRLN